MQDPNESGYSDPNWFRVANARERRIAAALFIGFGLFFVALFVVWSGSWFRWVLLVLGGYSILSAMRFLRIKNANTEDAETQRRSED